MLSRITYILHRSQLGNQSIKNWQMLMNWVALRSIQMGLRWTVELVVATSSSRTMWKSILMPNYATLFQAELTAVKHNIDKASNLGIRGKVLLHSDSLSLIQALQKQDVLSLQCYRTHLAFKHFSAKAFKMYQ